MESEIVDKNEESEELADRYPQKIKYQLLDLYQDLINFSSNHLVDNGYLVFCLPVYLEDREELK
jgi:hypothetical protein